MTPTTAMPDKPAHTPGPWTVCRSTLSGDLIGWHITAPKHGSSLPIALADKFADSRPADEEAANARLLAAAPDLLAALNRIVILQPAPGEGANDHWERVAAEFHRQTGYLAPGKDCRVYSPELRAEAWSRWHADHIDAARAAIARAQP